jgi:hypothetical protein
LPADIPLYVYVSDDIKINPLTIHDQTL